MDEACLRAEREEKNARIERRREAQAAEATAARPEPVRAAGEVDREAILLESLTILRGHLRSEATPPQSVAGIAKSVRETLDALGPRGVEEVEDDGDGLASILRLVQGA